MKQTGKIFTWKNDDKGVPQENPLKNTFFYFKQGNVRKATMQTNEKGEFSFDLPLGSYTIQISQGASFEILDLFAGVPFELLSTSSETAFNDWFMNPVTANPNENPLVVRLQQLAKISTDAATENQKIQAAMTENGYVYTKDATLAYLFGSPANGRYKTQDNDANFINLTPLKATNAYVDVHNYSKSNGSYIKLEWTYTGNSQGKRSFQILKTNGVWHSAQEIYKGNSSIGLIFSYNLASQITGKYTDANNYLESGIYHFSSIVAGKAVANLPFPTAGILKVYGNNADCVQEFSVYGDNRFYKRKYYAYSERWTEWALEYNASNTTVDSNGNIKKASPIIKLFHNRIEWNEFFKETPVFEKLDTGVYKISNTNGLARGIVHGDWYIETPKNRNGFPYFMVDWEQDSATDDIIIRTFKRKFDNDIGDFVNGEPQDIGENERWIDLRFHEQIYSLTNELPQINIPYRELWGVEPYSPPALEQIEENIALLDQRAF